MKQANYVVGNNLFRNTFNQGCRNHPNFSWHDNQNSMSLQQANPQLQREKKVDIDSTMAKMVEHTSEMAEH